MNDEIPKTSVFFLFFCRKIVPNEVETKNFLRRTMTFPLVEVRFEFIEDDFARRKTTFVHTIGSVNVLDPSSLIGKKQEERTFDFSLNLTQKTNTNKKQATSRFDFSPNLLCILRLNREKRKTNVQLVRIENFRRNFVPKKGKFTGFRVWIEITGFFRDVK